jgi:hypothetical protein
VLREFLSIEAIVRTKGNAALYEQVLCKQGEHGEPSSTSISRAFQEVKRRKSVDLAVVDAGHNGSRCEVNLYEALDNGKNDLSSKEDRFFLAIPIYLFVSFAPACAQASHL